MSPVIYFLRVRIWTKINENLEYEVKQYFSYVFQFFMVSLVGR